MEIYTTGFTKKSAAEFFEPLREAKIERLVDVRLNNSSQLAGFTKKQDLAYFLRELSQAEYKHEPLMAPTPSMLRDYRSGKMSWGEYSDQFNKLLGERHLEQEIQPGYFLNRTVLLCSEKEPTRCHRRLVAEYLRKKWTNVEVIHL